MKLSNEAKAPSLSNLKIAVLAILIVLILFIVAGSVQADYAGTPMVITTVDDKVSDDGLCSLREAVIASNDKTASGSTPGECQPESRGSNTILLPAGLYQLSIPTDGHNPYAASGDLDIDSDLTIKSQGEGLVVIHAIYENSRVFEIHYRKKVTLSGMTISGGDSTDFGGGIYNNGYLDLENVTLTNNKAAIGGGGLYSRKIATLTNVTITDNDSPYGSGIKSGGGRVYVINSMVVNDTCYGSIYVPGGAGINLRWQTSGCSSSDFGINENPELEPQEIDGLPGTAVFFHIPTDSPAADAGDAGYCPDVDQIGTARPQGEGCDIGAYEAERANQPPVATNDEVTTPEDTAVNIDVQFNDNAGPANEEQTLTTTSVTSPANGMATIEADGTVTYDPNPHFDRVDSFGYEICDSDNQCASASVTVTVIPDGFIEVTNTDDNEDPGSLRSAIILANLSPNPDTIVFDIVPAPCTEATINLAQALPVINSPVTIDGLLQDDGACSEPHIILDGGGQPFSGITLLDTVGDSRILHLIIQNFGGSGIVIGDVNAPSNGNVIDGNTITANGDYETVFSPNGAVLNDGVTIVAGTGNLLDDNDISNNADLAVDLGADGTTENDSGDGDTGANFWQNFPEIGYVSLDGEVGGLFNSQPDKTYSLRFYSSITCQKSDALTLLNESPLEVTTDGSGNAVFSIDAAASFSLGTGVWATATDSDSNTSEFSSCVPASENNVVWTQAKKISFGQIVEQFLATTGEARWYEVEIEPDSQITFDLTSLPANYDLTVYKDISKTYEELVAASSGSDYDLNRIDAGVPSEVIASASFTPGAYTPGAYTPGAYTPGAYTPGAYTPGAYTPGAYTQDVIAPGAYTPGAYTPGAYTPGAYTPGAYTPNPLLPDVDPALYSSAQLSSLIAVSAFDNLANESVTVNTWTNTGNYYVRVRGRNGAAVADDSFFLEVTSVPGDCDGVNYDNLPNNLTGPNVLYQNSSMPDTVFLIDWTRLGRYAGDPNTPGNDLYDLNQEFHNLAARTEIDGVIVEIGQPGSLINELNQIAEANNNYACPYAKNVVAEAIRDVVNDYRSGNGDLTYVVIVGTDDIIPFFRVPDTALLGPESWFQPPVSTFSASEASLRANYVLTDDYYGAEYGISSKDASIPAIDLAVGRLVETPKDMLTQIRAYKELQGGVINPAGSLKSLVTGYDFLVDAVDEIESELSAGTGLAPDTLISPYGLSPLASPGNEDPNFPGVYPWTGPDLLDKLKENDKDLVFLAGHFSANSALAADFRTGITTNDFLEIAGDPDDPADPGYWKNVIVYSAGCHSGYNIVDEHGTPYTQQPDWASAFASRGALLVGGTGYQFGDTQFIEYSERLYLYFTQQLRADSGAPISVGQAMVAAKQQYLAETPLMRGLHQKSLIEATIYGLPMLAVDMPNRASEGSPGSEVNALTPATQTPGFDLGLRTASVTLSPDWAGAQRTVDLQNVDGAGSITASWLAGPDGVVTNMGEVALPRFSLNVSPPAVDAAAGYTLRGVGFRGGDYTDLTTLIGGGPIYPLVGAPATEIRAIHLNWLSAFWFPLRTWSVNLYDNLFNGANGDTRLFLTPAQYRVDSENLSTSQNVPSPSVLRRYNSADYRLYYSNYTYTAEAGTNNPGSSAPPNIARVIGTPNGNMVDVEALVVGNPGAGIQEVWVTFTGESGTLHGSWQSIDMMQDSNDSTIWKGSFDASGTPMEDVRFVVQACSGTGLCSLVDNVGTYFVPGDDGLKELTKISIPQSNGGISSQKTGDEVTFKATLSTDPQPGSAAPLSDQPVFIGLGSESRLGVTDANGVAEVTFLLVGAPGDYEVTAWFTGNSDYASSTSAALPFEIKQQSTSLSQLEEPSGGVTPSSGQPLPVVTQLRDGSSNQLELPEQAVLFEVTTTTCGGTGGVAYKTVYTGLLGEAVLGELALPGGSYTLCATFLETPSYGGSSIETMLIINNAPEATGDNFEVEGGAVLVVEAPGVLGNDTDPDFDTLTATLVSGPSSGTLLGGLGADGSFSYQAPSSTVVTQDSFTYKACDPLGDCAEATVTLAIQHGLPPICDNVTVLTVDGNAPTLWPPNKRETDIYLSGATDPDGDDAELNYFFLLIQQDEKYKGKKHGAAISSGCQAAWVRSDRDGKGNGRVYEIHFEVRDNEGGICTGTVDIATLPHDQGGDTEAIKDSPLYSSGPSSSCTLPEAP